MPRVVVNELNISVFELTKLTGNSRETLLDEAEKARKSGHELTCEIPQDIFELYVGRQDEDGAYVNVFAHQNSDAEPSPQDETITVEQVNHGPRSSSREVGIRVVGTPDSDDIVDGEIVEED